PVITFFYLSYPLSPLPIFFFSTLPRPPISTLFPYTTLFRSNITPFIFFEFIKSFILTVNDEDRDIFYFCCITTRRYQDNLFKVVVLLYQIIYSALTTSSGAIDIRFHRSLYIF